MKSGPTMVERRTKMTSIATMATTSAASSATAKRWVTMHSGQQWISEFRSSMSHAFAFREFQLSFSCPSCFVCNSFQLFPISLEFIWSLFPFIRPHIHHLHTVEFMWPMSYIQTHTPFTYFFFSSFLPCVCVCVALHVKMMKANMKNEILWKTDEKLSADTQNV